jgi:hypothetical protein
MLPGSNVFWRGDFNAGEFAGSDGELIELLKEKAAMVMEL